MCLFKDCTSCPNLCVVLGILLPVVVFLFIRALPVKSLESDKEQSDKLPTDNYMVKTGFAVAFLSLTCLMLCCVILGSNFSSQLIGRRIDSVSVRELKKKQQQEQERLNSIQRESQQDNENVAPAPAAQLPQDQNVAVPGQDDARN